MVWRAAVTTRKLARFTYHCSIWVLVNIHWRPSSEREGYIDLFFSLEGRRRLVDPSVVLGAGRGPDGCRGARRQGRRRRAVPERQHQGGERCGKAM